jgi:hypothetical protein
LTGCVDGLAGGPTCAVVSASVMKAILRRDLLRDRAVANRCVHMPLHRLSAHHQQCVFNRFGGAR